MKHYKTIVDGYLISVSTSTGVTEIHEEEYNEILDLIRTKPIAPEGYGYRLREDLEWELYELPPVPKDDELSAEEALDIITGGNA